MGITHKLYKVLVYKLPWTVSKCELKAYFAKYGYVQEAVVEFDKRTGLSKFYGHVTFIDKTAYDTVLQTQTHKIDDCLITVKAGSLKEIKTIKDN